MQKLGDDPRLHDQSAQGFELDLRSIRHMHSTTISVSLQLKAKANFKFKQYKL